MIDSSRILLDQITAVLNQISPGDYSQPLDVLQGASIGAHVRHTIEFYECLLHQSAYGTINYDLRCRNPVLENSPEAASVAIENVKHRLEQSDDNVPLTLQVSYDPEGIIHDSIETNFYRELSYVIEHTVHHMALLKIGLQSFRRPVQIGESFGVAISTLRYRMK